MLFLSNNKIKSNLGKNINHQQFHHLILLSRLNRLQTVTVGDTEQLVHIVHLDLRDTGLQELDVTPLCRLELLRCDRNTLSLLRVSGHALKSLHAAHNGTTNDHYV